MFQLYITNIKEYEHLNIHNGNETSTAPKLWKSRR